MKELDLLNSYDVLSVARRWAYADTTALDLAQRLTSRVDIDAEVTRLAAQIPALRRRESFWERLSYVGIAPVIAAAVPGVLLVFGVDVVKQVIDLVGITALRIYPILGVFFWILAMHCSLLSMSARQRIEQQLKLLKPVVDSGDCQTALKFIDAGRAEVLAWRDIALYDREVLYAFDVAVLRALHNASLDARTDDEKQEAVDAACRQLYGIAENGATTAPSTAA